MIVILTGLGMLTGILLNHLADSAPELARQITRSLREWLRQFSHSSGNNAGPRASDPIGNPVGRQSWASLALALITAAVFDLVWVLSPDPVAFIRNVSVCTFLLLTAIIDLKFLRVLNVLVVAAALVTVAVNLFTKQGDMTGAVVGATLGFVFFSLPGLLNIGVIGWGDIKLAALIGLMFGFPAGLWPLGLGVLLGGFEAVVMVMINQRDRKARIPYAPFLCLGAMIAIFYNPVPALVHHDVWRLVTWR